MLDSTAQHSSNSGKANEQRTRCNIKDQAEVSSPTYTFIHKYIHPPSLISHTRKNEHTKQYVKRHLQITTLGPYHSDHPTDQKQGHAPPSSPLLPQPNHQSHSTKKTKKIQHSSLLFLSSGTHTYYSLLLSHRHALHFLTQRPPIVSLQLGVLDPFLRPLLMQSGHMILALLEESEFVADAFCDEDAAGMLLDNGFLVLFHELEHRTYLYRLKGGKRN